jgi:hypothetical protein
MVAVMVGVSSRSAFLRGGSVAGKTARHVSFAACAPGEGTSASATFHFFFDPDDVSISSSQASAKRSKSTVSDACFSL